LALLAPLLLSVCSSVPVDPSLVRAAILDTTVTLTPVAIAAKVGDRDTFIGKVTVGTKNCPSCALFFNVIETDKAVIISTFKPSGSTKQNAVIVRSIAAGTAHVRAGYKGHPDTSAITITDTTTPPPTCTPSATVICPGDNWQAKVTAAPTGTVFTIGAGVHRLQSVVAKQNQQFVAQPGAIMSGAKLLTAWTLSGATWWVGGQTQEFGHSTGVCKSGTACQYPEDVYRDDVLLHRELSLAAVGPGDFYFDYAADRIYVGDDPNGHKLEAAATEYAFGSSSDGAGTGVVLDGLVIEKYASAAQFGAVGRNNTAGGWIIRNCEIRFNHGGAIRTGAVQVLGGRLHHNGEIGIVGGGDVTTLVRGAEIDHNNTVGFDPGWESGGIKFAGGTIVGVRVIGNNIHDNDGSGLWADGFNDQFVWDSNTVANNTYDGVKVEISYGGKIRWNTVTGNGFSNLNSDEGDGIMVYASGGSGLEIAFNTLSGNKHGVMLIGADRGTGPLGPLVTQNVNVHDNTVTLSGSQRHGAVLYSGTAPWSANNHFEQNTYNLQTAAATPFLWQGSQLTDAQWRATGNDDTGNFIR
jgi:parallel beta-helix repeat protein